MSSKFIETKCHKCDTEIMVGDWDYSPERNYCVVCALSYLGEVEYVGSDTSAN